MVGASPNFSDIHLMRTLLLLYEKPTGRKKLVRQLGVGEGSVRTILKRMWAEGLVESHRSGQKLSESGEKKVKKLLARIRIERDFHSDDLTGKEKAQVMVMVKNAKLESKSILDLRDLSIRNGADGAIILIKKDDGFIFPKQEIKLEDYGNLHTKLKTGDITVGDTAIICWADDWRKAEDAALSIATQLM